MLKRTCITLIIILKILFLSAQTNFSTDEINAISGFVYDNDSNPLPFASITIENSTITTYTNSKGQFSLNIDSSISADIFVVVACHGYENERIKVKKGNHKLSVILTQKANYLNEVVVTGTRTERTLKDVPILTKVISSSDLQNTGSVTALDALENILPGVHFDPSSAMGDNIQVQGLDNNYVLILVDGERVVPERKESVNFARLNIADIERVEVINGASSVLYGSNAIGAVINIITKNVKKPLEGYAQARYSKYNTLNTDASVGFRKNKLSSKTTFNLKTTDGYDITPESPTSYTVNPNSDVSISQTLGYKFTKDLNVSIGGSYYGHETNNPPRSSESVHNLDKNYRTNAKIDYSFSDNNFITGSAHTDIFKSYKVYEKKNDSIGLDGDYYYSTFRIIDTWTISDKYQIISGIEHNDERTFSNRLFGSDENKKDKKSYNLNAFTQGTVNIIKNLDGVLGLRYTNHSGFGSHLTPSISLMYKVLDIRLRTGINNGFKAPTLKEMYYNFNMAGFFDIIGNPDLKSESSWYKFISAEYINEDINTSVSFAHNKISNKINIVERHIIENGINKTQQHYQNVDNVEILSVDVSVQYRFFKHFQVKAAYAFADAKDINTKLQINGNSKHNITSSVYFRYPNVKIWKKNYPFIVTLTGRYFSPRVYESQKIEAEETITISSNTEDFYVINLVFTQKIPISGRWNAELQIGVDNLFNNVDDKTFATINPGRRFFIMTRINF